MSPLELDPHRAAPWCEPTTVLRSFTVEGDGNVRYGRLTEVPDTRETTVALAVESARRWALRTDLSADVRLRRMWTVLTTALEG